jgi:hypothetical protein
MRAVAEASDDHTPAGDEWTIDDAVRYLTRTTGKPGDQQAVYELTEKLLAGRLSITAKHFVDGACKGTGVVPATFWRDHLALHVVDGRAQVRPLKALERGDYHYTLSSQDVRLLWPLEAPSNKKLIEDEVGRRAETGEQYANSTELARSLHEWMKTVSARPLEVGTIVNGLRDWGLWPLQPPKK